MFRAQKSKSTKHFTDVLATFGVEQRLLHSVENPNSKQLFQSHLFMSFPVASDSDCGIAGPPLWLRVRTSGPAAPVDKLKRLVWAKSLGFD
jgi:hypothetical protein